MDRDGESATPLAGVRVALPETRELDRLATILEEEGAVPVRCPLVAILDAPDPEPVDVWLRELAEGGFDDLVFLTGEGIRRLLKRAETIGLRGEVVAGLSKARKITRGPKPARALHELGLATDLPARSPTSQGVMEILGTEDLSGHRIGVQLYGTDPNEPLVRFLKGAGAKVRTVAPYIYAPASDTSRVATLIDEMLAERIDIIAFTSAAQVDRLWDVAQERNVEPDLRAALKRVKVAAIGPIVCESLADRNIRIDIVPEQPFILKRLIAAMAQSLSPHQG